MSKITEKLIRYELGELDEAEIIEFFQELIDTRIVWALREHYCKTAQNLIACGYCSRTR